MLEALFFKSVWIGLSIAAPVGPIGLLVIQRTLRHGRAVGLATGLGAAVADAAYGAVGAFGVTALINALQQLRVPLALLGGGFLLWLAWRSWHSVPPAQSADLRAGPGLGSSFGGSLLLTLSNPATVLSFIAIFGAMGASGSLGMISSPWLMVAGVLAGSALWWLLLCAAVGASRRRFDARAQHRIGQASALMLTGFALWQWAQLV